SSGMVVRDTGRESFGSTLLGARVLRPASRVLVPLIRGQSAGALLRLGDAVARKCSARGIVLSLVEMPPRLSTYLPAAAARSRELLRWIASNDYPEATDGQRLGIETRFTSDPAASIREAVLEAECDAVLAE